jgi:hypothetical protein
MANGTENGSGMKATNGTAPPQSKPDTAVSPAPSERKPSPVLPLPTATGPLTAAAPAPAGSAAKSVSPAPRAVAAKPTAAKPVAAKPPAARPPAAKPLAAKPLAAKPLAAKTPAAKTPLQVVTAAKPQLVAKPETTTTSPPLPRPASPQPQPALAKPMPAAAPDPSAAVKAVAVTKASAGDFVEAAPKPAKAAEPKRPEPASPAPVKFAAPVAFLFEGGIDKARQAYATAQATREQWSDKFATSASAASMGLIEINGKVFELMRWQTDATFNLWKTLLGVTSMADAVELQTRELRKNYEATTAQMKDIAETATRIATDTMKPVQAAFKDLTKQGS